MASISIGINNGFDGFKISDFTVGTNAPTGVDMEFRFNTTDANANVITIKRLTIALEAFTRAVQSDALFILPPGI